MTSAQIVDAIKAQLGVEVDRKRISRGGTIKTAGLHEVEVNLYRDINAKVSVQVGPEAAPEPEAVEEVAAEVDPEAAEETTEETAE